MLACCAAAALALAGCAESFGSATLDDLLVQLGEGTDPHECPPEANIELGAWSSSSGACWPTFQIRTHTADRFDVPMRTDGVCTLPSIDRAVADSTHCLSCHDGTVTALATYSTPTRRTESHPVGVVYDESHARGRGSLRPRPVVDPALVFVDGKVECTTCHNGVSSERSKAAVSMRRSTLCFACHDM